MAFLYLLARYVFLLFYDQAWTVKYLSAIFRSDDLLLSIFKFSCNTRSSSKNRKKAVEEKKTIA
jgi:hypothetical protein